MRHFEFRRGHAADFRQRVEGFFKGPVATCVAKNITLATLKAITGIPAPGIKIPYWVALAAGHVSEGIARVTGKPPRVPLAGVRMARYKMWFNPAKAIRELGLPQTPVKEAMIEAVAWFRANGYVKK